MTTPSPIEASQGERDSEQSTLFSEGLTQPMTFDEDYHLMEVPPFGEQTRLVLFPQLNRVNVCRWQDNEEIHLCANSKSTTKEMPEIDGQGM
jgi:hypothetical protein